MFLCGGRACSLFSLCVVEVQIFLCVVEENMMFNCCFVVCVVLRVLFCVVGEHILFFFVCGGGAQDMFCVWWRIT